MTVHDIRFSDQPRHHDVAHQGLQKAPRASVPEGRLKRRLHSLDREIMPPSPLAAEISACGPVAASRSGTRNAPSPRHGIADLVAGATWQRVEMLRRCSRRRSVEFQDVDVFPPSRVAVVRDLGVVERALEEGIQPLAVQGHSPEAAFGSPSLATSTFLSSGMKVGLWAAHRW